MASLSQMCHVITDDTSLDDSFDVSELEVGAVLPDDVNHAKEFV